MNDLTRRQRDARSDLISALRSELLGPASGEDEELSARDRPTLRYLMGRLAPAGTAVAAEEDEGIADAGDDDADSDTGNASPVTMAMNPSSIGLSFIVVPRAERLEVTFRWGRYEAQQTQEAGRDGKPVTRRIYRRRQSQHTVSVDMISPLAPVTLEPGIRAEFLIRRHVGGRTAASVFLVNRIPSVTLERPEEDEWLFQPEICARAADGRPAFAARGLEDVGWSEDPDLLSNELLYWNHPEYATGHGCAAAWTAPDGDRTPATEVRTEVMPSHERPRVDPRESEAPGLEMSTLGGPGPDGVQGARLRALLSPVMRDYREWIDERLRTQLLPAVPPELTDQAHEHLDACEHAYARILEGIELVATDEDARKAFCFANRAMALQRERSIIALARRRGEEVRSPIVARWRPFQVAFILLNLSGMTDRRHRDRGVADLLWFPTGGGKTEAYLGLTAFALAHRRLRVPAQGYANHAGVTVLMRYTLRLLTVQQFQRATTLICACEFLRESEGTWGENRFTIGLWVGSSATPNRYADAKEALEALANGHLPRRDGGSPVQLLHCPWCGAKLTRKVPGYGTEVPAPGTYTSDDDACAVLIHCADEECYFSPVTSDGIPAHTVDEQLYRHVPSLVIATVDKFARMPFNGRTQALFGRVRQYCSRHGYITAGENHPASHRASKFAPAAMAAAAGPLEPPDLVIQDELHLISGPLGTLVGLYETAVDALSSVTQDGQLRGPKIIASTATIRRSGQQINALFRRAAAVFPPPGIDSADSWFGQEVPLDNDPGRIYLGVFAPGKSVKTALVRVYSAVLSRAKALHDGDAQAGDPYMTMVGYFNSLRELGGALRLIQDDVPGRIGVLNSRDAAIWPRRTLFECEELTSNKRAEEVPRILDKLERRFTAERPEAGQYPVDTILASNMISVGVDIDRLGLMIVNGQPKTTAEYIQATSRIGRQSPGLVVTVFNWTRPRDISHYERFRSYHSSVYRFVEATSVTPFSSRARDKGLQGVVTALIRLGCLTLTGEQDAANFDPADPAVQAAAELTVRRASGVTGSADDAAETREEVMADLDRWTSVAVPGMLCYSRRGLGPKPAELSPGKRYLLDTQEARAREGVFTAPGSLREVESEIHVYLLNAELSGTGTLAGDRD